MSSPLEGRTALVTGGAKRLGRAVCEALASRGARLAVHYRTSGDEAESFAAELKRRGIEAIAVGADLAEADQRAEMMARVSETFPALDILVNSASIFPEDRLDDMDSRSLAENMETNTIAPLDLSRRFSKLPPGGSFSRSIVNFLDTRIHDYDKEHVSYHLSKRALFSLTRMMAEEFAPAIRVNGIAPGLVLPPAGKDETYLQSLHHTNPLNTHGSADDVANAVVFLLENDFITGQIIYVDGGRHMKSKFYG